MNQAQKDYLDREIKRSIKWCRRSLRINARHFEQEQAKLEVLWCLRQKMRKLEVAQ